MHIAGQAAAAACAAQLSYFAINRHGDRPCPPLLRGPCLALEHQMRSIQRRIHATRHAGGPSASPCAPDPRGAAAADEAALRRAARLAAAVLAAACLQLGSSCAADALDLASATEDRLLGIVRQMETGADTAMSSLRGLASSAPAPGDAAAAQASSAAADLINEVFELVGRNFADVRGTGFDPGRWAAQRDAELARAPGDARAAHSAARRMLASLRDPYSRFLSPEEFSSMAKYDVSGVGLNLGSLEDLRTKTGLEPQRPGGAGGGGGSESGGGGAWVVGLIRGSPAESAGMRQGDEIVAADGASLAGRSPFEVASLLQGPDDAGSDADAEPSPSPPLSFSMSSGAASRPPAADVTLRVRRLDGGEEDLTLARPARDPPPSPVTAKLQGGGRVGYIRLTSFNARAQRDVAAAVRRLEGAGAARLVLDLRGNRGGLVSEGVEVARLFLDDGAVVVRTQGPRARAGAPPPTAPGPPLSSAPLAVLVDSHTASASEIVAGALRDNCRAVLVGGRTYGKGLIQSVYELGDGSGVVLTVGKYLTPAGTDIDLDGIAPDFGGTPSGEAEEAALRACRLRPRPTAT